MAKLGFAEIDKAFRESGLSNSEIDKASTKFLINPAYKDATKDDLEKYIADYKDNLGLHDITETTVEAETTKDQDTNSNEVHTDNEELRKVPLPAHNDILGDKKFKYNTFASFFNPEKSIVVTPTDHLDVFISAKDDYIKTVKNIIENKNGSKVFHFTQKNIK